MKRILSLLLAACMVVGMMPMVVRAEAVEDGAVYVAEDASEPETEPEETELIESTEPTEELTIEPTVEDIQKPTIEATAELTESLPGGHL